MLSPKIFELPTNVRMLSGVSIVVAKRPISFTTPVTPPAVIMSPTWKGRSTIMNTPAAKFESRPDQAMPIATPAAARTPAKEVVSTPKTLRIASRSMSVRTTPTTDCRYRISVASSFRRSSTRSIIRCTAEMMIRPTIHKTSAPTTLPPIGTAYVMSTRLSSSSHEPLITVSVTPDAACANNREEMVPRGMASPFKTFRATRCPRAARMEKDRAAQDAVQRSTRDVRRAQA